MNQPRVDVAAPLATDEDDQVGEVCVVVLRQAFGELFSSWDDLMQDVEPVDVEAEQLSESFASRRSDLEWRQRRL